MNKEDYAFCPGKTILASGSYLLVLDNTAISGCQIYRLRWRLV